MLRVAYHVSRMRITCGVTLSQNAGYNKLSCAMITCAQFDQLQHMNFCTAMHLLMQNNTLGGQKLSNHKMISGE